MIRCTNIPIGSDKVETLALRSAKLSNGFLDLSSKIASMFFLPMPGRRSKVCTRIEIDFELLMNAIKSASLSSITFLKLD